MLAKEIERKYLLSALPPAARKAPGRVIQQGYLPGTLIHERLRRVEEGVLVRYFRTVKLGRGVERIQSGGRALSLTHGDRPIQRHDGRLTDLHQSVVEKNDPLPVCLFGAAGSHVTCGNGRLQRVGFRATA